MGLQVKYVLSIIRFRTKLVSFILSVTNTLTLANTLAYFGIRNFLIVLYYKTEQLLDGQIP
jgi:hypothetical protein